MIALSLAGASKRHPYSPHEKAFFLDDATVEFVRPGLNITVNSATIAADGTISAVYTVTDPNGLPLDAAGVTTPGTINLSFVAAVIPSDQEQYTTYTTRAALQDTMLGTIQQPGADSGGTSMALAAGQYQYTFKTKAPAGYDSSATHTIGIYGSRNLTVYNLGTNYASATFNFVPNGAKGDACARCDWKRLAATRVMTSCQRTEDRAAAWICACCATLPRTPIRIPASPWTLRSSSTRSTWARIYPA